MNPALQQKVVMFSREVVDLLRAAPRARMPFNRCVSRWTDGVLRRCPAAALSGSAGTESWSGYTGPDYIQMCNLLVFIGLACHGTWASFVSVTRYKYICIGEI